MITPSNLEQEGNTGEISQDDTKVSDSKIEAGHAGGQSTSTSGREGADEE